MASSLTVNTSDRLNSLRVLLKQADVNTFVVPSEDQHASEYPAKCDERRAFISGFDGSAGCAIITTDEAFLFTDGRYFLQAANQLDNNWTLMKQGLPDVPTWQKFLSEKLKPSSRIGIDPALITEVDAAELKKSLVSRESVLVSLQSNPVDAVWGKDRPLPLNNPVFTLDVKYSGETLAAKLTNLRAELEKKKAKAMVVTMLDEIAWLFNLRGSDVDYNPVFTSYAIITATEAVLFVNHTRLDENTLGYLRADEAVQVQAYEAFFPHLKELVGKLGATKDEPIVLGDKASLAVAEALGPDTYTLMPSPVAALKSIKNSTEMEGFRQCHIRDGAALARYFSWLEKQLEAGVEMTESQGADQLEKERAKLALFKGLSFDTISSTGPNGAIIHYSPGRAGDIIKKDQIYLCDSGGQYFDGTTDVTRTWHFGTPTEEEKRAFTRVLQGHISIDTAIFPNGTSGFVIDSFARRALWQDGLDYRHGTGHGVGHFLNVHEGPHGIGVRIAYNNFPLKAGMTVSNEPGYYADGKFGIRIENVVLVREAKTPNNFGDKGYLGFEHVTMCPMHKKLIDTDLLSKDEKDWVNKYHAEVLEKVGPLLGGKEDERALKWLQKECAAF